MSRKSRYRVQTVVVDLISRIKVGELNLLLYHEHHLLCYLTDLPYDFSEIQRSFSRSLHRFIQGLCSRFTSR